MGFVAKHFEGGDDAVRGSLSERHSGLVGVRSDRVEDGFAVT